jgi:hypothetical protein
VPFVEQLYLQWPSMVVPHEQVQHIMKYDRIRRVIGSFVGILILMAETHAAEFWLPVTTIKQVFPDLQGVYFTTAISNSTSLCDGGTRWLLPSNAVGYSALSTWLSLAAAQGLPVWIHVNDLQPTCTPIVDSLIIQSAGMGN